MGPAAFPEAAGPFFVISHFEQVWEEPQSELVAVGLLNRVVPTLVGTLAFLFTHLR